MRGELKAANDKLALKVASDGQGGLDERDVKEKELASFTQANAEYIAELDKTYVALVQQLDWINQARLQALEAQRQVRDRSNSRITDERNLN
jgi:hypothetical protein